MNGYRLKTKQRVEITIVPLDDARELADETYEPYAVLRAKSEMLAEFLGCTDDEAERLILDRVCNIGA